MDKKLQDSTGGPELQTEDGTNKEKKEQQDGRIKEVIEV